MEKVVGEQDLVGLILHEPQWMPCLFRSLHNKFTKVGLWPKMPVT